jgi:hypothetical protein
MSLSPASGHGVHALGMATVGSAERRHSEHLRPARAVRV